MAKVKVFAIHEIRKAKKAGVDGDPLKAIKPKRPEIQVIEPGTAFMLDDASDDYKEWKANGAIRDWTEDDSKAYSRLSNVVGEFEDEGSKSKSERAAAEKAAAEEAAKKAAAEEEAKKKAASIV